MAINSDNIDTNKLFSLSADRCKDERILVILALYGEIIIKELNISENIRIYFVILLMLI
jgi:hypothetical protein